MTVRELIDKLQKLNQDAVVVISSDSEGNYYSPLYGSYEAMYSPNSTWSGDVWYGSEYEEYITDEDYNPLESSEDRSDPDDDGNYTYPENSVPCVVLTPTN